MEKIYGYKLKDVEGLAEFIKNRGHLSLTEAFEEYGEINNKAKGTVRNLYYAMAKRSATDALFCQKYFCGTPLKVSKIEGFNEQEEKALIKNILLKKEEGKSVRGAIMEMTGGDGKMALRFQNKFRNALKHKPRLIAEVIQELKDEGKKIQSLEKEKSVESYLSESQIAKLKKDINSLVAKISYKTNRENQALKERVALLERENLRLSNLLYAEGKNVNAIKFFKKS